MSVSTEIEVKLLVDDRSRYRLSALPVIGGALKRAKRHRIETAYYDTADHTLARHGLAMRVRRGDDGATLLSVKQQATAAIARQEWEKRISGNEPHPEDWQDTPVAPLLGNGTNCTPRPLFVTAVDRATCDVVHEGASIEVAFDRGEVKLGARELPICEVELELKAGDPQAVFDLARELAVQAPLRLGMLSKGERGYMLGGDEWGMPRGATTPEIARSSPLAAAIRTIFRTCLKDYVINEGVLADGYDEEAVHQARIALRRLRSAFALFKADMADGERPRLKREIGWLWGLTGAARDLDVMTSEIEAQAAKLPTGANRLVQILAARRHVARRELKDGIRSDRSRLLLFDLVSWIENGSWSRSPAPKLHKPIMNAVRKTFDKRLRKLKRRSRGLSEAGRRKRHRVRIAAKSLRLMSDFFESADLHGDQRKHLAKLSAVLGKLQKSLGRLQDRALRDGCLREIARGAPSTLSAKQRRPLSSAIEALIVDSPTYSPKILRKVKKQSAKLAVTEGFWH